MSGFDSIVIDNTTELETLLSLIVDIIEQQPDRPRKIAALRCYTRGLYLLKPLPEDAAILSLSKNANIMRPGNT